MGMMPEGRWVPGTMIPEYPADDSNATRTPAIPAQRDGFDSVVLLDGETAREFVRYLNTYPLSSLRFAIDDGGIKVKVNGGSWSPPIGKVEL